jgi:hypothetical protein
MDDEEQYEYLVEECARIYARIKLDALDDTGGRFAALVMALPERERVLYFVIDVHAVTFNAGMGDWIASRADNVGWIDEAVKSCIKIGFPDVGAALEASRKCYLIEGLAVEGLNYSQFSKQVWHKEFEIIRSLYCFYTSGP